MSKKPVQQEKMDYESAKQRLENHANLDRTGLPIESSLLGVLWLVKKGEVDLDIADLVADILDCLQVVNKEANGPDPDTRAGPSSGQHIVLENAYYVSGIVSQSLGYHRLWSQQQRFSPEQLYALETDVHKIAYAWDQLLASDMSDLLEGFDLLE